MPSPEPAGTHGNTGSDASETGRVEYPESMGFGDADKGFGFAAFQAGKHPRNSHARIHDNGDRPCFEQGECQGKKIQTGRNHQNRANSPCDADGIQTTRQAVGLHIQLSERQLGISDSSIFIPSGRGDHGTLIRMYFCHVGQVESDVHQFGIGYGLK